MGIEMTRIEFVDFSTIFFSLSYNSFFHESMNASGNLAVRDFMRAF